MPATTIKKFTERTEEERAAIINARREAGATGVGLCLAVNGSSGAARTDANGHMTPQTVVSDILDCAMAHPLAMVHFHARTPEGARWLDTGFTQEVLSLSRQAARRARLCAEAPPLMNTSTSNFTPRDAEHAQGHDASFSPISGHVRPDIASLTPGDFPDFGGSMYLNPPEKVTALARQMKRLGIKPELEVFCEENLEDIIALYRQGREQGADGTWRIVHPHKVLLADPIHIQFVFGARRGADDTAIDFTDKQGHHYDRIGDLPETYRPLTVTNVKDDTTFRNELDAKFERLLSHLHEALPDARWSAFGIGRYRDPVMRAALEWTQGSGPVVLRTGVEDGNSVYDPEERKNLTNAELLTHQAEKVVALRDTWQKAGIATDTLALESPAAISHALGTAGHSMKR
ncbi:MAG: 3-keto-5-aminohexanoate cleavage protein [Alphaproteobacteria bacterium]|nr:3-keto-5-aminohexanoate cleavage protein [Alphaproteobacteria bacterium]